MRQFTRRNHFVPQAYLRRWAGAQGKVWCYRLLVSDAGVLPWKLHSVRSIGFHEHLYTTVLAGRETDQFEAWIEREFETPGQRAIAKVVSERRLTPEDWKALIRYTAAQDVRTPARYIEDRRRWDPQMEQMIEETLRQSIAEWEAADDATRETLARDKPAGRAPFDFPFRVTITRNPAGEGGWIGAETIVGRQMWLAKIHLHLTTTIRVLHEHRWSIMRAPEGMKWLTTDDPVVRLNYTSDQDYNFGGGWGSTGSEFLFPLSPTHLLYTQIGRRHESRITPPFHLAQRLQRMIAKHAHRWIYSAAPVEGIDTLRPRKVDRVQYAQEMDEWKQWHRNQTAAELELQAPHVQKPSP